MPQSSILDIECAMQTRPNLILINECLRAEKKSLQDVVSEICDLVCARRVKGKNYGAVFFNESILESLRDTGVLIKEIQSLKLTGWQQSIEDIKCKLTT